jgi:methionyl-tRNA formyltransferase
MTMRATLTSHTPLSLNEEDTMLDTTSKDDPVRERPETSQNVPPSSNPRIVLFGIRCAFTNAIIRGLASIRHPPVGIVLPGHPGSSGLQRLNPPRRALPMASSSGDGPPDDVCPTFNIGSLRDPEAVAAIDALRPDIILVACFTRRIPAKLRATARIVALNIHPSLLPLHRGPDPLFWTLRHGDGLAGVTIHELVDELDAGPILAQVPVRYLDGISEAELERLLSNVAIDSLRILLPAVQRGSHTQIAQDESQATYETWPDIADYTIDTHRSARSAFNFIRGVAAREIPVTIDIGIELIEVAEALACGSGHDLVVRDQSGIVEIAFADGTLRVRPAGLRESNASPARSG